MMIKKHGRLALPLLAALVMGACDDGGTGGNGDARVSIRLTDAPGDLDEAWVRIDRIYLMGGPADSAQGGRVDLLTTATGWVNLLTLSGGRTAELVNGFVVPAGTYRELRFVVCEAYVVTNDGEVFATPQAELPAGVTADGTLQVPSGCSSGLKVKFPSDVPVELENDATILSVDFDVSQSFGHQAGNSGRWVMRPVLTATEVGVSGGIAGTNTIMGLVWAALQWRLATEVRRFSRWGWYGAMAELAGAAGAKLFWVFYLREMAFLFLMLLVVDAFMMRYFWTRRGQFDVSFGG